MSISSLHMFEYAEKILIYSCARVEIDLLLTVYLLIIIITRSLVQSCGNDSKSAHDTQGPHQSQHSHKVVILVL
jgi:hypothetical protein